MYAFIAERYVALLLSLTCVIHSLFHYILLNV